MGRTNEQEKIYRKKYRKENKEMYRKIGIRSHLKRTYNLTLEQYNEKLKEQNFACAICGYIPKGKDRSLAVDHNHDTGVNRGLLCAPCNRALGMLKEDPFRLHNMIEYINKWNHAQFT